MMKIGPIIKFEFTRNIKRWSIWVLIIFVLLSIAITQLYLDKYKNDTGMKPGFLEIEATKIKHYPNYSQFLLSGFRILALPSPLVALFYNNTAFGDLVGLVDNGIGLKINKPQVGCDIFDRPTGGILDLSWFMLIIGSAISMFFGFMTFGPNSLGYMKFYLNFASTRIAYAGIILSRILLLSAYISLTILILWLQLIVNGIILDSNGIGHLLVFLLVLEITMASLFIIGTIPGAFRNMITGGIIAALFWLAISLFWPEILNSVFSKNAATKMKPIYELESQKLAILMEYENQFFKKYKTMADMLKASREMSEYYLKNEFKKIERLESEMIEKSEDLVNRFHFWSILNPITFYRSVNNELSSRGYKAYLRLYKDLQKKQRGFLRYYVDQRFYKRNPQVEPYLKEDEYIFQTQSSLPKYFGVGIVLNIFYVLIAFGIGNLRFRRVVFPKPEYAKAYEAMDLRFETGKYNTINCDNDDFKAQIFNILSGCAGKFSGKIAIDGENVVSVERQDFLYLPDPNAIPSETKVKTFISLIFGLLSLSRSAIESLKKELANIINKRFIDLDKVDKIELLLKIARIKKASIYLFINYLYNIPNKKVVEKITAELKDKNNLIIELTSASPIIYSGIDRYSVITLSESEFIETKYRGE